MTLYLPPKVSRELQHETDQRNAMALQALNAERGFKWIQEFNHELQRIDPYIKLVWCPEPAPVDAIAIGARGGRWNLFRKDPAAPAWATPITGPNGEFVEPTSAIFDKLQQMDWWNPRNLRERKQMEAKAREAKERREQREREEHNQETYERWLAANRTFISMDRSKPWTQSAKGRRPK